VQAVVLAGGLGTRLYPITKTIPKPMVPILGRPFLDHMLEMLATQGFEEVVLLTGYLGKQIREHVGDGSRFGLSIRYRQESGQLLGTGGALREAVHLLRSWFFLIYGDSFLPLDYADAARAFHTGGTQALMVVLGSAAGVDVVPNVRLDDNGRIVSYRKGGGSGYAHVDAGVLVLRREVVSLVLKEGPCSLEQETYPRLAVAGDLLAYPASQRFYDIGTPAGVEEFSDYLRAGGRT